MTAVDPLSKCRCCLVGGAAELFLFTAHSSAVSYADMLRQCCSLEVFESDGNPPCICVACSLKLCASYKFREMCLHTNDVLAVRHQSSADSNAEAVKREPAVEFAELDFKDVNIDDRRNGKLKREVEIEFEGVNVGDNAERHDFECEDLKPLSDYKTKTSLTEVKNCSSVHRDICDITFNTEDANQTHRVTDGSYACDCGATFAHKPDMVRHRRDTHGQSAYKCEHCTKSYSRNEKLELHMKKFHTRVKRYGCGICKRSFYTRGKLQSHELKHGSNEKDVSGSAVAKCEMCGKRCHTRKKLKEHIDWVHRGIKFYCEVCQKYYTSKSRHIEMNHGNGKRCDLCDTWHETKMQYHVHINQMHRDHLNRCDCGAALSANRGVEHACSIKKYVCQYCAKIFKNTSNFNIHLKTHTKERPFECDICNKSFSDKGALNRHKQRHTNLKDIKCDFCSSMFRTRKDLSAHITMHDEKSKRYACGVCGKLFRRSDHRNNHQRNVHKLEDSKPDAFADRQMLGQIVF